MASAGCYSGYIPNGFVVTSSCEVYNSRTHCRFYCNDKYEKTASTVYCAGNDKWKPSGNHLTQDTQPCRWRDQINPCDDMFIKNGYVVTCPYADGRKRDCMYRCFAGYKPASSRVHCIENEWLTSDTYSEPCIPDASYVKPSSTTKRPAAMTTVSPRTTYPGYYDDPNLKMHVSPVVFVAAVIGGLLAIGLLIFVIFFRAHRKSTREARERSLFIAACDPLSAQNDYTNNGVDSGDTPADNSQYREVARRIISQSQNQNTNNPPPYTSNSSSINPPLDVLSAPAYSASPYEALESGQRSPPYSTVYNPGHLDPWLPPASDQQDPHHTVAHGIDTLNNNPPPYEEIEKHTEGVKDEQTFDNSLDPPPPYTRDESEI